MTLKDQLKEASEEVAHVCHVTQSIERHAFERAKDGGERYLSPGYTFELATRVAAYFADEGIKTSVLPIGYRTAEFAVLLDWS